MDEAHLEHMKNEEALLAGQPAAAPPAPVVHGLLLLNIVGFAFLTFNSAMAVYRSDRPLGAISFVAFSYLDLILLFYCLKLYERAARGSPRREHLKVAVWLLATMLVFAVWTLMEFWFVDVANGTGNSSSMAFQNQTSGT